jgi:azurin
MKAIDHVAQASPILVAAALSLLGASAVRAAECQYLIEGSDELQYSQRQLHVPASCATVELTLKHSGREPVNVIGHNWVLSKSSDVNAVVTSGLNAGRTNNYQSPNDSRILAATPLVGGGESTTIRFSTERLQPGADYSFFCTYPGHSVLMKGSFVFGEKGGLHAASVGLSQPPVGLPQSLQH